MKPSIQAVLLAGCLMASLLTGCGQGEEPEAPSTEENASTSEEQVQEVSPVSLGELFQANEMEALLGRHSCYTLDYVFNPQEGVAEQQTFHVFQQGGKPALWVSYTDQLQVLYQENTGTIIHNSETGEPLITQAIYLGTAYDETLSQNLTTHLFLPQSGQELVSWEVPEDGSPITLHTTLPDVSESIDPWFVYGDGTVEVDYQVDPSSHELYGYTVTMANSGQAPTTIYQCAITYDQPLSPPEIFQQMVEQPKTEMTIIKDPGPQEQTAVFTVAQEIPCAIRLPKSDGGKYFFSIDPEGTEEYLHQVGEEPFEVYLIPR